MNSNNNNNDSDYGKSKEDLKNVTMGDIFGTSQKEKQNLEENINQEILNSKSNNNLNQQNKNEDDNDNNDIQNILQDSEQQQNLVYQQLAQKYNIPLGILDSQDNKSKKKMTFNQFNKKIEEEKQEKQQQEIMAQMQISEAQQLAISKRVAKRRHISSYKVKKETDMYLRDSFLDKKENEETPQIMRYLDGFRPFQPEINIGNKAGDMIKSNTTEQMKFEMSLQRGKGFLWHAAKTGKLGIDLYLCVYAVAGLFLIPYYFYKEQQSRLDRWTRERGIDRKIVDDYEEAGYDLDDLSIEGTFENMYTKEILEEKRKKIEIHQEIGELMNLLYKNK